MAKDKFQYSDGYHRSAHLFLQKRNFMIGPKHPDVFALAKLMRRLVKQGVENEIHDIRGSW